MPHSTLTIMKIHILSVFIIISCKGFSQQGTLLISAITEHGIIMAADSRGCIYGTGDHATLPLAYYDSACKIFQLKQFIISIGGASGIGQKYYSEIINSFNKIEFQDTSLINTFRAFLNYMDKHYPVALFPERKSNKFLLGGYVNGIPQIMAIDSSRELIRFEGTLTSDSASHRYFETNNAKPQLSIVDLIEQTIYDYAKGEKKEYLVGGPISFVLIKSNNEIVWLKNNFSQNNYREPTEFYKAVEQGRIQMHYLVPDGKKKLFMQVEQ